MNTGLPIPPGWIRLKFLMTFARNGARFRPIEGCSLKLVHSNSSEIRMLTCTLKADWIGFNSLLRITWLCSPHWSKVSLQGCSKSKVPLLGAITRAEKLQVSLFLPYKQSMTGIQRSMPCPRCGLMYPWWGWTTCGRYLVTTFTTCGRSTGCLACGALFARSGPFWSSIWRQQGRDGTRLRSVRKDSSPTGPINLGMIWRMKSELMTIGMLGDSGRRPGTVSFGFASLVKGDRPDNGGIEPSSDQQKKWLDNLNKHISWLWNFTEAPVVVLTVYWKRWTESRNRPVCFTSLFFNSEANVGPGSCCLLFVLLGLWRASVGFVVVGSTLHLF